MSRLSCACAKRRPAADFVHGPQAAGKCDGVVLVGGGSGRDPAISVMRRLYRVCLRRATSDRRRVTDLLAVAATGGPRLRWSQFRGLPVAGCRYLLVAGAALGRWSRNRWTLRLPRERTLPAARTPPRPRCRASSSVSRVACPRPPDSVSVDDQVDCQPRLLRAPIAPPAQVCVRKACVAAGAWRRPGGLSRPCAATGTHPRSSERL